MLELCCVLVWSVVPIEHERAGCGAHAARDVAGEVLARGSITAHEVLVRRTRYRLAARARIEILDGYLLVDLNVDEVIRIICTRMSRSRV